MSIKEKARRFVRQSIRLAGFQRRIAPDFVDVMSAHGINVVFDVGANDGDYGREIRDRGYKGFIVSFEPNQVVFERLRRSIAQDSKWFAYSLALGEEDGEALLSVAENDTMSSFKELTDFGRNTGARQVGTTMVRVAKLDTFLRDHSEFSENIYLKIDTQGFEMEV